MPLPSMVVKGALRLADGSAPADVTPCEWITAWIRERMPEFGGRGAQALDRVLLVRAKTGSGKSTALPVAIFRILRSEAARGAYRGKSVICTQPRVLTAIALAADVAGQRWSNMEPGKTIGFVTGPVSNRIVAGLIYATVGVLAAQLRNGEDAEVMERYRVIVVDEAHERSLESDMALALLRSFYDRNAGNARLPFLLLTSATFDPLAYAAYFGVPAANTLEVEGRAYPIETRWPAVGTNDYPAEAAATALRLHEAGAADPPGRGDVLVFVPGAAEAAAVVAALARANKAYTAPSAPAAPAPLLVLTLNREVVLEQAREYDLIFAPAAALPPVGGRPPARRVIVATVVAETGVTIESLRYVVDGGWLRAREVYQPTGAAGVVTRPAPRSRVEQRKGRAGRLFAGVFAPLYTERVHAALDGQQLPDIHTVGPAPIFLAAVGQQQRQLAARGARAEFRAEALALLDPPAPEAYLAAAAAAAALGFVAADAPLPRRWPPATLARAEPDEEGAPRGWGLTPLGQLAALFGRVSMEGARVLLAGYVWGAAAEDLATAVALFGAAPGALLAPREARGRDGPPGAAALVAALPPFLAARAAVLDPAGPPPDLSLAAGDAAPRLRPAAGGRRRSLGADRAPGAARLDLAGPPDATESAYLRARLLLACDFAEGVLLFAAYTQRLEAARGDARAVAAWCDSVGLDAGALALFTAARELVVEEMVLAGLDPYRAPEARLAALPAARFTAGLVRFKRCLHDGLRARLLRHAPDGPDGRADSYVTSAGLRVAAAPLLSAAQADRLRALGVAPDAALQPPRWLLTDEVRLAPARGGPLLYALRPNLVSVLDGYVDVDASFDAPRAFAGPAAPAPPAAAPAPPEPADAPLAPADAPLAAADAPLTPAVAAERLEAYLRVLQAAAGPLRAPAAAIADGELAAFFGHDQAELLVRRPFRRPPAACPD